MKVVQVCEVCLKEEANSISHDKISNKWLFACSNCLTDGYFIEFKRIKGLDWEEHMRKKGWVLMEEFLPRLLWVRRFS